MPAEKPLKRVDLVTLNVLDALGWTGVVRSLKESAFNIRVHRIFTDTGTIMSINPAPTGLAIRGTGLQRMPVATIQGTSISKRYGITMYIGKILRMPIPNPDCKLSLYTFDGPKHSIPVKLDRIRKLRVGAAQLDLGLCYQRGVGTDRHIQKAVDQGTEEDATGIRESGEIDLLFQWKN
ncbi:4083_t:CDS:2 [Paraglomus brasilianum]|uniref:4083_t:CDS:1 n=1 Tax=Paraglomus brasilianum TaxID=144538 RepID=A0A9N9AZZ7_9GLOM|nr:4083_t:CDS:2 [Paraglomus brasilianum]